jgi:hypothetical protein
VRVVSFLLFSLNPRPQNCGVTPLWSLCLIGGEPSVLYVTTLSEMACSEIWYRTYCSKSAALPLERSQDHDSVGNHGKMAIVLE